MSKVYPALLKRFTIIIIIIITFEKIREVWISNDFLKLISIEFWIRNTLLHKFFQTDMIFFDQFKVPRIKFGKCFAEFMIPIALLKLLAVKNLLRLLKLLTCEDAPAKRISCHIYIHHERDVEGHRHEGTEN